MSAAFNCVDHLILLQRLQVSVGIGTLCSTGSGRFSVDAQSRSCTAANNRLRRRCCSAFDRVRYSDRCCLPLYTAPLFDIMAQHPVNAHQYADDLQLYLCACCRRKLRSLLTESMRVSSTSKPGWKPASSLTRAKLGSFGLDLRSSWPRCGLMKFQCCQICERPSMYSPHRADTDVT